MGEATQAQIDQTVLPLGSTIIATDTLKVYAGDGVSVGGVFLGKADALNARGWGLGLGSDCWGVTPFSLAIGSQSNVTDAYLEVSSFNPTTLTFETVDGSWLGLANSWYDGKKALAVDMDLDPEDRLGYEVEIVSYDGVECEIDTDLPDLAGGFAGSVVLYIYNQGNSASRGIALGSRSGVNSMDCGHESFAMGTQCQALWGGFAVGRGGKALGRYGMSFGANALSFGDFCRGQNGAEIHEYFIGSNTDYALNDYLKRKSIGLEVENASDEYFPLGCFEPYALYAKEAHVWIELFMSESDGENQGIFRRELIVKRGSDAQNDAPVLVGSVQTPIADITQDDGNVPTFPTISYAPANSGDNRGKSIRLQMTKGSFRVQGVVRIRPIY